eukprot:CAMPEP_0205822114 /NCGR_PEP_ID=MMETSP0206-20130828/10890_1 /ASSEMBLY_ACC=CAM_ASM_000279 /TAXON_ID=36767 /ORGANISM="Euplotes focardii, Strain TN1" /LENGTH=233 /DNA_ID=CAMNT_0053118109 /DNA_START=67 /DNA_END=768 /DNA_ORIENTATION=-
MGGRPAFGFVQVYLGEGQQVVADAGSLLWMDGGLPMETGCHGGCMKSYARTCAGESCCQNTYTGPGMVAFGFEYPGDVLPFAVSAQYGGWVLTKGAFIAGSVNTVVSTRFAGCCASVASGEGAFLTKVTSIDGSPGMFFAGGYGSLERHEVPLHKRLYIDNGLFFAAHEKTRIGMTIVGGMKECMCGGEGLVMSISGPAVVYTQSRDPAIFQPKKKKKENKAADQGISALSAM